jgi:hypothetical protein
MGPTAPELCPAGPSRRSAFTRIQTRVAMHAICVSPCCGADAEGLSYVDGPPWQALFWRFERFGRLRSYVRPLSVRSICPRALMKSDDRDPYQPRELFADDNRRVVPGLRWRPCRSSRLVALAKLEPVNLLCEPSLRRRAASLRLRENLRAETFTGLHHRPEDPGELVGQRHRNQPRRLLRQQANNPVAQGAFALAHYV